MTMYEKSKRKNDNKPKTVRTCPICGEKRFSWGKTHLFRGSSNYPLAFRSNSTGMFESSQKLRARKCTSCGNIQLFADVD